MKSLKIKKIKGRNQNFNFVDVLLCFENNICIMFVSLLIISQKIAKILIFIDASLRKNYNCIIFFFVIVYVLLQRFPNFAYDGIHIKSLNFN